MPKDARFTEAITRIDDANREDPRTERIDGVAQPRELLFAQRVYEWVTKLVAEPSEELLLAARAHTLRRWMIPRDQFPRTNLGYHEWRDALAAFHAEEATKILSELRYPGEMIQRVQALIIKEDWPNDQEGRSLEDADCLAFLEMKLHTYLDEWDEGKTVGILRRTLRKMTPHAQEIAMSLPLHSRCLDLLRRVVS
jgi:hypothetical protein